jgi:SAM-dependent methyltransferase
LDIARRAGAHVTAIDFDADHDAHWVGGAGDGKVEFLVADALVWDPVGDYDVVVLSNVLEHIAPRVELLRRYAELVRPSSFLIRVPMSNRDWTVPLREELGLPYMSDDTHEVEYTEESFRDEMSAAGLEVVDLRVSWGEIWAQLRPLGSAR